MNRTHDNYLASRRHIIISNIIIVMQTYLYSP